MPQTTRNIWKFKMAAGCHPDFFLTAIFIQNLEIAFWSKQNWKLHAELNKSNLGWYPTPLKICGNLHEWWLVAILNFKHPKKIGDVHHGCSDTIEFFENFNMLKSILLQNLPQNFFDIMPLMMSNENSRWQITPIFLFFWLHYLSTIVGNCMLSKTKRISYIRRILQISTMAFRIL